MPVRRNRGWRKQMQDESGLSLVEILIAVTIMAIISVTMMGYFIAAMDKSEEESRRIIAANLARQKAAELRNAFQDQYDAVQSALSSHDRYQFTEHQANPASNLMAERLASIAVNGTTYHFLVALDNSTPRKSQLDGTALLASQNYLARMLVTVYWSDAETFDPPAKSATTIDTYIVKRW
jgi:type II secretory pathway pseudopilin PulG